MIARALLATVFVALLAATPLRAAPSAWSPEQKAEIDGMIHDYLLKNPEVVQEAMVELERRQKDKEQQQRLKLTSDKASPLYASPNQMVLGNPKGDVTLVEFFDYNCGYCKKSLSDIQKLIDSDKNLRVVLKEFPVLGPGSVEAAQVAMALLPSMKPEQMSLFHAKLLSSRGQVGRDRAVEVAKDVGVDVAKMGKNPDRPEVAEALRESVSMADQLGLTGTPSFVLGDEVIVGAVGYDELKTRVDSLRKCGKSTC